MKHYEYTIIDNILTVVIAVGIFIELGITYCTEVLVCKVVDIWRVMTSVLNAAKKLIMKRKKKDILLKMITQYVKSVGGIDKKVRG